VLYNKLFLFINIQINFRDCSKIGYSDNWVFGNYLGIFELENEISTYGKFSVY